MTTDQRIQSSLTEFGLKVKNNLERSQIDILMSLSNVLIFRLKAPYFFLTKNSITNMLQTLVLNFPDFILLSESKTPIKKELRPKSVCLEKMKNYVRCVS